MITNSYDNKTKSKIIPKLSEDRPVFDVCIITFSYILEDYIVNKFKPEIVGYLKMACGKTPIYSINYNGKKIAIYKTLIGAPATVGLLEDSREIINTNKYIVFGGCGCLNKEIARGKVMIPTEAYRDEGTSYHYAEPSDYITIKNSNVVASFMDKIGIPYVLGKTWTIDAFYRETEGNFEKRKSEGCISVEMECSALQAVCNHRDIDLYYFLSSGDLLDSPEWDRRIKDENDYTGTQHDSRIMDIALELADYVS